jgi:putative membrane protein
MLSNMQNMLPAFLGYFAVSMVLLAVFAFIYTKITPYNEIALIRRGNTAASISLAGTLLGFAMPIANVIAHSDTIPDLIAWSAVACIIQILAYLVARLAVPQLINDIPEGKVAPAVFLASLSVTVGLINAACMTY